MNDLDTITIRLRRECRNNRMVRENLWLIAFTAAVTVAYIAFYATR